MQIDSPSRDFIATAMEARTARLTREGKLEDAEQAERDRVTLSRAPGEDLYDIYQRAHHTARGAYWGEGAGLMDASPLRTLVFGSGVAVGGLCLLSGAPPLVGAGILGASALGLALTYREFRQRSQALRVLKAVEAEKEWILGYVPATAPPSVPREAFLSGLRAQEAALAAQGEFDQAERLRRVHTALEHLPGFTAEELLRSLVGSEHREVLELIQGSCGAYVLKAMEDAAGVSALTNPSSQNAVEEGADRVVVGGVVLKRG